MRFFPLVLLLIVFTVSYPAYAQDYRAGSIGYLFEDCRDALKTSETFEDLHGTYCGAFVEGYAAGIIAVQGVPLEIPQQQDEGSCHADRKTHYQHINNRFCANLPAFDESTLDPAYIFENTLNVVARWVSFLHETKGNALEAPLSSALNTMLKPGNFCDNLAHHKADETPIPLLNPALLKQNGIAVLSFLQSLADRDKYTQCVADLKYAGPDRKKFQATRCGAEITGFMIGLQATAHLQDSRPPVENAACGKEIHRLYKALNVQKTMCISPDTNPLLIADIYTENYDLLKSGAGMFPLFESGGMINNIGYDVIYRGFLCLNER